MNNEEGKGQLTAKPGSRKKQLQVEGKILNTNNSDIMIKQYLIIYRGKYAGLFFATDTIWGETNIVTGIASIRRKSGMAKNKEQLKICF